MKKRKKHRTPNLSQIEAARSRFRKNEPRDLFYRAATELVESALCGESGLSLSEAVAVLLQTWNSSLYRYKGGFKEHDLSSIECFINSSETDPLGFRNSRIENLKAEDETRIVSIFQEAEVILGPVGASKCLHLLAPEFFPLWDRSIADEGYNLPLGKKGSNEQRYWKFIGMVKQDCETLNAKRTIGRHRLKAIDEFNYCRYTKHWSLSRH